VKPDRVVFNALISACGESGAVARAFDVLSEMTAEASESKGCKPILPDHVTVGALMKTCIQAGQVVILQTKIFSEIQSRKFGSGIENQVV
jgi:pentatricopeptide repeat protein